MPPEMLTIDTPRGRFAARAAGPDDGRLALLMHGFPDDAGTFDALSEHLAAKGLRAVAPYCRGYHPSPLPMPAGERDLFETLARDALAIADALSPGRPVHLVGHDLGAFAAYRLGEAHPDRIGRMVTLAAAHPVALFRNTQASPAQWWRSRYVLFFQIPGVAESLARMHDFAYLVRLWREWSPKWVPPAERLASVRRTLRASWPVPIRQYRLDGFGLGGTVLAPTLFLCGAQDGCAPPSLAAGQEASFGGRFESEVVPAAGHFLHLERPEWVNARVADWLLGD